MDRLQAAELLKSSFIPLSSSYKDGALDYILQRYGEEHRGYHNEKHIASMLGFLEQFKDHAVRPDLIAHAILWHDVVYLTREENGVHRPDALNVADSMTAFNEYAVHMLDTDRQVVSDLIGVTNGHRLPPNDMGHYTGFQNDAGMFLDLDLSAMAASWENFREDTRGIYREFLWVGLESFCLKHADILEQFSRREPMYFVVPGKDEWTKAASRNLQKSVEHLRRLDL